MLTRTDGVMLVSSTPAGAQKGFSATTRTSSCGRWWRRERIGLTGMGSATAGTGHTEVGARLTSGFVVIINVAAPLWVVALPEPTHDGAAAAVGAPQRS